MTRKYVDIEGIKEIKLELVRSRYRRIAFMRELVNDIAEHATAQQRIYAPSASGYLHAHIGHSTVNWSPGGPGGGGTYTIVSGVRRGTSQHPLYVHFGTKNLSSAQVDALVDAGNYQPGGSVQGKIYPRNDRAAASVIETTRSRAGGPDAPRTPQRRRPALTFQKKGEPRKFRAWVHGQKPKPFVYFAFLQTSVYAKGQLAASGSRVI